MLSSATSRCQGFLQCFWNVLCFPLKRLKVTPHMLTLCIVLGAPGGRGHPGTLPEGLGVFLLFLSPEFEYLPITLGH